MNSKKKRRGVDKGIFYNKVVTLKCSPSKITLGKIPNITVGINNAIKTLNSLLVTSCNGLSEVSIHHKKFYYIDRYYK